ncbi:hypothetical protein MPER_14284 [Moniliophthora perniciosa FA553]|nr:hypothetical protein MPER_14284 [Moniliophthora perniciosa FA553]
MLRELCYDQDLFILQVALIILDPNTVIVSILDRFSLLGYFSGASAIRLHHYPERDCKHLKNVIKTPNSS